jgi:hypothetical protein
MAKIEGAQRRGPVDLAAVLDESIAELQAQGQLGRWRQQILGSQQVLADCDDAAAARPP